VLGKLTKRELNMVVRNIDATVKQSRERMLEEDAERGKRRHGQYTEYAGAATARAITEKLRDERCNGDRWAHAYQHAYDLEDGYSVYYGLDRGAETQKIIAYRDID